MRTVRPTEMKPLDIPGRPGKGSWAAGIFDEDEFLLDYLYVPPQRLGEPPVVDHRPLRDRRPHCETEVECRDLIASVPQDTLNDAAKLPPPRLSSGEGRGRRITCSNCRI